MSAGRTVATYGCAWTPAARKSGGTAIEVLYCFYTDIDEQQRREADYRRQRYFMSLIDSSLEGGFFVTDGGDERRLATSARGCCISSAMNGTFSRG